MARFRARAASAMLPMRTVARPRKRRLERKESTMNLKWLAVALLVPLGAASSAVEGKGCIKGAAVGGLAGHVAGHHGVAGAAVGCAIGHHEAAKKSKQQAAQNAQANTQSGKNGKPTAPTTKTTPSDQNSGTGAT
jgi:hypothetical protein